MALEGGGFALVGSDNPYDPSVIGTTYDSATGREVLDIRLSTWEGVDIDQPKSGPPVKVPYDPKIFTTTMTVQHRWRQA